MRPRTMTGRMRTRRTRVPPSVPVLAMDDDGVVAPAIVGDLETDAGGVDQGAEVAATANRDAVIDGTTATIEGVTAATEVGAARGAVRTTRGGIGPETEERQRVQVRKTATYTPTRKNTRKSQKTEQLPARRPSKW